MSIRLSSTTRHDILHVQKPHGKPQLKHIAWLSVRLGISLNGIAGLRVNLSKRINPGYRSDFLLDLNPLPAGSRLFQNEKEPVWGRG